MTCPSLKERSCATRTMIGCPLGGAALSEKASLATVNRLTRVRLEFADDR